MRCLLAVLILLPWLAKAADFYVRKNGSDGDPGSSAQPWLTLNKAASTIASGDTVFIGHGEFDEYVQVTIGNTRWIAETNLTVTNRAFRFDAPTNWLQGVKMTKACDAGWRTWDAFCRLDSDAHWTTITNCHILDQPWVAVTNWSFNPSSPTNTISSISVDLIAKGFVTGGVFWVNGVSYSNTTRGSEFRFSNQQRAVRPTNVTTTTMTFSNAVLVAETNPSVWAVISAGATFDFKGISFTPSGGTGPTNCLITGCLFSNMVGQPLLLNGHNNVITNCEFTAIYGNSIMVHGGSNHRFISNYVHHCPLPAYYSELEIVDHTGGNFYDYYVRTIIGSSLLTDNTNFLFQGNWFEEIDGAGLAIQHVVPGDETDYHTYNVIGNVFIGVAGPSDGGQNIMRFQSNTFYRCSFQSAYSESPVTIGGVSGESTNSTLYFTENLMVVNGDHRQHTSEGYQSITLTTGIVNSNNFVCGPEVARWNPMAGFPATNGINGGDPMFVNEFSPRGPDGIPFTADDGLRLHPNSPAVGIGAMGVTTNLFAFFRPVNVASNFLDATGTNFNLPWHTNLYAFTRTTWDREYDIGDALLNLPMTVRFEATNSVSGNWSTNEWYGIRDYVWEFKLDGESPRSLWTRHPDITYTFARTGAVTITLTVTNWDGDTSSHIRKYRVMPISTFTNDVMYASASVGTTSGSGTQADPWSLTNALAKVGRGDVLYAFPGDYTGVFLDFGSGVSASNGTPELPITLVAYAQFPPVTNRVSHWIFEGIEITSSDTNLNFLWWVPTPRTNQTYRNLYMHDSPSGTEVFNFGASGGQGSQQIYFTNCYLTHVKGQNGSFVISSANTIVLDGNILTWTHKQSDLAIHATNVVIRRTFFYAHGFTNGNHSDFIAYYNTDGSVNIGNYLIERNWFEMPTIDEQFALSRTNSLVTITNNPSVGDTLTIAGITRVFSNAPAPTHILIGATIDETVTNLYQNALTNVWDQYWIITAVFVSDAVQFRGKAGPENMASSMTGTWGNFSQSLEWSMPTQIANTGNNAQTYQPGFTNFIWRNNVCLNVYNGLNPATGDGHKFYNNLFSSCAKSGGSVILLSSRTGSSLGAEYFGNIFFECGNTTNSGWYDNGSLERHTNLTIVADYNYVAHTNFLPKQPWDASRPTNQYPFLWKLPAIGIHGITNGVPSVNQPAQEDHGINGGDPKFTDSANYDFRLLSTSPLINAGVVLSGFTTDFWGRERGATWDIGPFESESEAAVAGTNRITTRLR